MDPKPAAELSKPDRDKMELASGQHEASPISWNNEVEERIQKIKEAMADRGINLTAEDMKAVFAYIKTEQQWAEVYRRLAES